MSTPDIEIKTCTGSAEYLLAARVVEDYIRWLGMDLAFQDIDREVADLRAMYAPPEGKFLLAWYGGEVAGGGALRKLEPAVCEMKRLYVYDRFKGRGLGRGLCAALISEAREMGYAAMRLDTLGSMTAAIGLYRTLGFREIEPYRFNPDPTTRYLELVL